MANSYLTRTNSSTGSTTKATISMWVKFSNISTDQALWENYSGSVNGTEEVITANPFGFSSDASEFNE